jgi:hypothetical protein
MSATRWRMLKCCVLTIGALALTGCAIVTDMINPEFLSSLGLNPEYINRGSGRIVLAFRNSTSNVVLSMGATTADDPYLSLDNVDLAGEDFNFWDVENLAAGETRTLVVDCPIYLVLPAAATVLAGEGAEQVEYTGVFLLNEEDYRCGDVIEIEVIQGTTGMTQRVRVIPGR